jgi:hypothetical protein
MRLRDRFRDAPSGNIQLPPGMRSFRWLPAELSRWNR